MQIIDLLTIFFFKSFVYYRLYSLLCSVNLKITDMKQTSFFTLGSDTLDFSKSKVRVNGKTFDKYSLAYYMIHLPGCYYRFLHYEIYNSTFTYKEIKQALLDYVENLN